MITTTCPRPAAGYERILLAHGGGGRLTHQLISRVFYPAFDNSLLRQDHDGSVFEVDGRRLAFTTDSFVVNPILFPGGTIGDLAVNGTVNDLACCGAVPLYLTAGFIIEEGLPLETLKYVVASMEKAARQAGVAVISGDTKVVERGKCDGLYINTSGIGSVPDGIDIAPRRAADGDAVICSGPIGVHGIAILSARESLGFESTLESDTASLNKMLSEVLCKVKDVHVLRDPTRGGVSGTLNEIASAAGVEIVLEEDALPVPETVRAACELLGFDPLYVANEGVVLAIVAQESAAAAVAAMRRFPEGRSAAVIGSVRKTGRSVVKLKTILGRCRIVDMLSGEQLPRIC